MSWRHLIAVLAVATASSPGLAETDEPLLTLSLSASEVELGAPFFAYLEVSAVPGVDVSLPADLELGASIAERGRSVERTERDGRKVYNFEIELQAFDLGELEIPALPVTYAGESGGASQVSTATSRITVRGVVPADDDRLREPGPLPVVRRNMERVYWALAIGGGALLLSILLTILSKVVRLLLARPPPPPPTAVDRARHRFAKLEPRLDGGDRRRVFVELSEIVREFLQAELGVSALDATTAEIDEALASSVLDDAAREEIVKWLRDADLVKFAGFQVSSDETRASFVAARKWIDRAHEVLAADEVEGG